MAALELPAIVRLIPKFALAPLRGGSCASLLFVEIQFSSQNKIQYFCQMLFGREISFPQTAVLALKPDEVGVMPLFGTARNGR
jgi:hypothetical protein